MDEDYYPYIEKWFRKWAFLYDIVDIFISGVRPKVLDFISARNGSRILDIATGTGKQAFAFAKKSYDVIGIDLSEEMLKIAIKRSRFQNVKFEVADASNIPFDDKYFDVACVSFALHDMPLTVREKVLEEMARVTKPKGIIVIVDYALPKNKIGKCLIYYFVRSYESKYYSEFVNSDIEALLKRSRIEIEKEFPILLGAGRILKGIRMDSNLH